MDKATLLAKIDLFITTNGAQEITGAQLNELLEDIAQSYPNKDDDNTWLSTSDYNPSRIYAVGMTCLYGAVLKRCIATATGSYDAAKWADVGSQNSCTEGLTAYAAGGQASATALPSAYNFVDIVAAPDASVKAVAATVNAFQYIQNNGANNMNVYPQTGHKFKGMAINDPISVPPGGQLTLACATAGEWRTF